MHFSYGDYTHLARDYARYRAGYAPEVPALLLSLVGAPPGRAVEAVDVGAGTGIWTRMLAAAGCRTTAVEPNEAMAAQGRAEARELGIEWRRGSAEDTGLAARSADLLTMASAFHWADFERASAEFARVLCPGGVLALLWNTRLVEADPLLAEIEAELERLVPDLERVSSGRSAFCADLERRLAACGRFEDVARFERRHVERMTPQRYLGIWRSVNAVRVQAGEERFEAFLGHVERRTRALACIEATYLTRVWTARVPRLPREVP